MTLGCSEISSLAWRPLKRSSVSFFFPSLPHILTSTSSKNISTQHLQNVFFYTLFACLFVHRLTVVLPGIAAYLKSRLHERADSVRTCFRLETRGRVDQRFLCVCVFLARIFWREFKVSLFFLFNTLLFAAHSFFVYTHDRRFSNWLFKQTTIKTQQLSRHTSVIVASQAFSLNLPVTLDPEHFLRILRSFSFLEFCAPREDRKSS